MKNQILLLLAALLSSAQSYNIFSKLNIPKSVTKSLAVLPLIINPITVSPSFAIDAFDAASNAMLEKKERVVAERSVDKMPPGAPAAKKRKALALCKDGSTAKAAGYLSSAGCTSDVIDGNYDRILKFSVDGPPPSITKSSSSSSSSSKPSSFTSSSSSSKSEEAPAVNQNLVKKTDLSDLPAAAKKRRALAACKKPETRKFARMGTESKCTERVLQGDVDSLIEALEYGR